MVSEREEIVSLEIELDREDGVPETTMEEVAGIIESLIMILIVFNIFKEIQMSTS